MARLRRKQRPPKAPLVASQNNAGSHTALVEQHTTQYLLARVSKCIKGTEYENYSLPVASNRRTVRDGAVKKQDAADLFFFDEQNYKDTQIDETFEHAAREFALSIDSTKLRALAQINAQLEHILRGGNITTVQLRSLLTQQQYQNYTVSLTAIRDNTELMYGDGMPQELQDYNAMLKRGDFAFGKAERMSGMQSADRRKYKIDAISKVEHQSQHLYERALERLEEIFNTASGEHKIQLQYWMDRDVVFGADGNTGIDCERMPRVRGTKSPNAQDAGLPKLSKRLKRKLCALSALRDAACDIAFVPQNIASIELTEEQTLTLRDKLRKLKLKR